MKTVINSKTFFAICFSGTILFGCKKEVNSNISKDADQLQSSVVSELAGGATTITITPGPLDGQDTYVSKIDYDPNDGNGNLNFTEELVMSKYYYYGQLATVRSYLKFDSLSKIPATAKIVGARLFLYGKTSSISFPSGNSYYPGSGNPENACLVQRVTGGNWNENTLTWNTMPATTTTNQDTIPASTNQWNYNTSVDVTKLVAAMVRSGKNYGFCLRQVNEESYRILEFSTSEAATPSLRPQLVIRYK